MNEPDFTAPPEGGSFALEQLMEAKDLPESDRDELRRFAEFLAWRKAKKAMPRGEKVAVSDALRQYLTGETPPPKETPPS